MTPQLSLRAIIFYLSFGIAICSDAQVLSVSKGSIDFRSEARLELIKANSNELLGKLDISKKEFAFKVKMRSFNGFNSPLQKEHFNENYLESDRFPDASFSGKIIEDIDLTKEGVYTVRAKGNFTLHGVSQERIIKSEISNKNGVFSIVSNFTVSLSDHNIAIPKVVHEKLASVIKVFVKATVKHS